VLAEFATAPWRLVEGTAEGFGLTGIPFEALDNGEQRITLWSVATETWITAALRPGWDATRELPAHADLPAIVAALVAGQVTRRAIAPPKPPLFAGLFARATPEPVAGAEISVAGLVLEEWPLSRRGGVFTIVSPRRGTGS
jgi:hypothetical protein